MNGGKRRRRNAIAIKMELVDAVGAVLQKHGFHKLGINLVAQEAGVDKNVIYRNFEEFDKLLSAYIEKQDFWFMALKEHGSKKIEDRRAFMKQMLVGQFKTVNGNKELQELLLWELGDQGKLMVDMALKREIMSKDVFAQYRPLLDDYGINFDFIAAIMVAATYYLVLHKNISTFCETDLTLKKEQEAFIKTIEWLTDLVFDKAEALSEAERIAVNALQNGIDVETTARITGLTVEKVKALAP
jgi:AcrR family transcriptional regulator